jgi:8-oxo-dGTP diphosphatase
MNRPRVGIGIFVFNTTGDKFLIGKRIKENLYGLPGGKLEHGENFESSAARELLEETNIDVEPSRIEFSCSFNCIIIEENYHWFDVYMKLFLKHSEEEKQIKNMEEDKCEEWVWFDYTDLMNNFNKLFYPLQQYLNQYNIKSIDDIKNLKTT